MFMEYQVAWIKDLTMPATKMPSPESCNCFAVRAAARRVTQCYDHFLAPAGLSACQFSILARLKRNGPLTISELADNMFMDRTTLGRNVLPLERDGLIRIEATVSDRRAKALHLTKAGDKRLQAGLEAWSRAQAQFERSFGVKRAADLRAMLREVVLSDLGEPMLS
jgi:DNA-binding MarR family transcriptional regulator